MSNLRFQPPEARRQCLSIPNSTIQEPPPVPLLSAKDQLQQIENRPYTPFNTEEEHHSLAAIFLFALVGGLILNIMPCVLPVIPLKALSFIQQAHGNPRLAMLHGLASLRRRRLPLRPPRTGAARLPGCFTASNFNPHSSSSP